MMKKNVRKKNMYHYIFMIGIIIIFLLSIWKAKYGFGGEDESFYLTIPYRMCHGDKLVLHEWHVSQFSAFLLFPIMKLYLFFVGNTESIVLHFRYIYIFLNLFVGLIAYWKLQRYKWGAIIAVWIYLIFVPYNIMALSYNSMGLMLAFLCVVILFSEEIYSRITYIVAGILYAGIVLCQPLLSLVFIVSAFLFLLGALILNKKQYMYQLFNFMIGCCILAIPIIVYFLANLKVNELLISINCMLEDPEHSTSRNVWGICNKVIGQYFPEKIIDFGILSEISSRNIVVCIMLLLFFLWIFVARDKKRMERKWLWLSLSVCLNVSLSYIYLQFLQKSYINFLLFPWVLHGITTFFFLNKKCRKKLAVAYILGIEHAIAFLGSNQYGYVFCLAFIPTALLCILYNICMIQQKFSEENKHTIRDTLVLKGGIVVTICFLIYARVMYVFWQTPVDTLEIETKMGATKGIYVTDETNKILHGFTEDILKKDISSRDNVLILSKHTWLYLNVDIPLAQYSSWLSGVNRTTFERLEKYYEINPDKYPNKIYIDKSCLSGNVISEWAYKNDFSIEENDWSYFLVEN